MHEHGRQKQYPHQQHKAMAPWQPSFHRLHLDERCYCYTMAHGIEQQAKVSFHDPLLKDRPTIQGSSWFLLISSMWKIKCKNWSFMSNQTQRSLTEKKVLIHWIEYSSVEPRNWCVWHLDVFIVHIVSNSWTCKEKITKVNNIISTSTQQVMRCHCHLIITVAFPNHI